MLRYLPAGIEVLGLIAIVTGSFLLIPALGLVTLGGFAVVIGYRLEDAK